LPRRTESIITMPFIGNIGPGELLIVLVIALVVLGPGRLPEVGSALGKSIREFRKAASDVKDATSLDPIKTDPEPVPPTAHVPMSTPAVGSVAPTVPAPIAAPPVPADSPAADPGSESPAS
jgi:TatA/E family protein of Tat protein translocase